MEIEKKQKNLIELSSLTIEETLDHFKTARDGLRADEVKKRQEVIGKNVFKKERGFSPLKQLLKQFIGVMAILLWVAGILSFVAKMPELGVACWFVVIINGLFSFIQEYKADRALSKLSSLIPNFIKVRRDGELMELPATELTVGDIIILEMGNIVPADARIIESNRLFMNNSMLSGETVPLNRTESTYDSHGLAVSEIMNLIYAGTIVAQGNCVAVVYAIGSDTEIGKVSSLIQTIDTGKGTLDIQINRIVKIITMIAMIMGLVIFGIIVFISGMSWQLGFVFALGIIVANIPEGLLPTVNLSLAVAAQRMAKENALIKRLSSVETLSGATIICTDKTGTLTKNQLMIRKVWTCDYESEFSGEGFSKKGDFHTDNEHAKFGAKQLLSIGVLCNESNLVTNENNPSEFSVLGNPTDGSMLIAAIKYGFDLADLKRDFKILDTYPFTSETKRSSVHVLNLKNHYFDIGKEYMFTKGAPNIVLESCGYWYQNGKIVPLDADGRKTIIERNDKYASDGFRILALCYGVYNPTENISRSKVFVGLAVVYDPPREEVKNAVLNCKKAGIKITIITGDYGLTAAAIGKQVGIIEGEFVNMNGVDVDRLDESGLITVLKNEMPIVFSRTTPLHKLRIVEAYKKIGEIVAVTGDGVNDVLALKSAHIGIAMGRNGTDVARDAADMILLDDNFATIVKAVEEGRAIYANIKKFITYIFASNIPEIIPAIAMGLFGIPPALTVLQILSIDLGTDLLPALALGAEKPESGLLALPPRKKSDNLLDWKLLLISYGWLGMIEAVISMSLFFFVFYRAGIDFGALRSLGKAIMSGTASADIMNIYRYATTMTLMAIIACQIGNVLACRSDSESFLKSIKNKNPLIWFGILAEIIIAALLMYVPFVRNVMQTVPLQGMDYLILLACPVILLSLTEIQKVIVRGAKSRKLTKANRH